MQLFKEANIYHDLTMLMVQLNFAKEWMH